MAPSRAAPPPVATAITPGIGTPRNGAQAASRIVDTAGPGPVKIKSDADVAQPEAMRRTALGACLIVDPNKSRDIRLSRDLQPARECAALRDRHQPINIKLDRTPTTCRPHRRAPPLVRCRVVAAADRDARAC